MKTIYKLAQLWLKKDGHYTGLIDGLWGPLSKTAAAAWERSEAPAPPALFEEDENSAPFEVAKNYIGVREIPGKKHNPIILGWLRKIGTWVTDDETAWCSTFINYCALVTGRERTGKLNARSWLEVGAAVDLDSARKGDVVILWRGSKSSWKGHVAFLDHYNKSRGLLYLLGGNQNNEVNVTAYSTDRLLGIRRLRALDRLAGSSKRQV